jgi:hypothetical protein
MEVFPCKANLQTPLDFRAQIEFGENVSGPDNSLFPEPATYSDGGYLNRRYIAPHSRLQEMPAVGVKPFSFNPMSALVTEEYGMISIGLLRQRFHFDGLQTFSACTAQFAFGLGATCQLPAKIGKGFQPFLMLMISGGHHLILNK